MRESINAFDAAFYTSYYSDLRGMTEVEARRHFIKHGASEGRFSNPEMLFDSLENEKRKLPDDFDPVDYLAANPELSRHIDHSERSWEAAAHYLKYGRWEGRKYSQNNSSFVYDIEVLHRMTDNVHNMPGVVIEAHRRPTVNVLVPAFDFASMSAGFFGVFQVALFIKRCGFPVRLVMYDSFHFDKAAASEKLKHYSGLEMLFDELEVEYVGDGKNPLRISSHDNCVATVWYSAYFARKIMSARGGGKFLYLIQDYEPAFYSAGSLSALAQATYSFDYSALFSTQALENYFLKSQTGIFAREGAKAIFFNNACSSKLKPEEEFIAGEQGRPKRLVFYSRPQVSRNMFELGALALVTAHREGVFAAGEWEFFGIGLGKPVIQLAADLYVTQLPRMNLRDYSEAVSTFDLGLCLMASFHPSLLPFDLAGSGATVVTNSYGVKDQHYFDSVAPGIIVSNPGVPELVKALRKAVEHSSDLRTRYQNAKAMKYPRSWAKSFSDCHVRFIREIFAEVCREGIAIKGAPAIITTV